MCYFNQLNLFQQWQEDLKQCSRLKFNGKLNTSLHKPHTLKASINIQGLLQNNLIMYKIQKHKFFSPDFHKDSVKSCSCNLSQNFQPKKFCIKCFLHLKIISLFFTFDRSYSQSPLCITIKNCYISPLRPMQRISSPNFSVP